LIIGDVTTAFVVDGLLVVVRSGGVARLAERLCWAIMNAGTVKAKMRKRIPGAKKLFLTQPS
jgi:hypothetical protein